MLASVWALALMAGPTTEAVPGNVPMVGRDGPEADACGGIGRVSGLYSPTGEAFLSVREEHDEYARETDRLPQGTLVWLCDAVEEWQGIVYASGEFQELGDCRVSSPVAVPEPYSGPCKSGWVLARNLQLVGG
ncbi:hypothetical protein WYH_00534 [Croceibacterium atlanticum]|uniref:Integron n=2 Tax=Croceibacterium atlanticum TaxID=1267766 RepID=A0A0F7KM22_9SPHN|nr:hypothetical protein WYH_00534 [Croceibacterium atlanticum]